MIIRDAPINRMKLGRLFNTNDFIGGLLQIVLLLPVSDVV